MTLQEDPSRPLRRLPVSDICAAFILLLCLLVLLGWILEQPALTAFSIHGHFPSMPVNTLLGTMMLGLGLLAVNRQYAPLIYISALSALLFAGSALIEHLFSLSLDISGLLFPGPGLRSYSGGMPVFSAMMIGCGVLLLIFQNALGEQFPRLNDLLLLSYCFVLLTLLNTYLSAAAAINSLPVLEAISLPTTICLALFFCALVSLAPGGSAHFLCREDATARVFRNSALAILFLSILFNSLFSHLLSDNSALPTLSVAGYSALLASLAIYLIARICQIEHPQRAANPVIAKQQRQPQEQQALQHILRAYNDGVLLVDERRKVCFANEGITRIFGWQVDELQDKPMDILLPERFRGTDARIFHQFLISNERSLRFGLNSKALGLTKGGVEKPISIIVYKYQKYNDAGELESLIEIDDTAQNAMHVALFFRELSGVETEMVSLNHGRSLSPVTGLPNQREFRGYIEKFVERELRKDDKFLCLIYVDLDNFKVINTKYGRELGDRVLQNIGITLKHRLRPGDKLFHYDADEYVLVCECSVPEEAELMAERIRTTIKVTPTKLHGKNVYLTSTLVFSVTHNAWPDLAEKTDALKAFIDQKPNDQKDCVVNLPWE